ncbi:MAG TPA: RNA-binding protein [Phycicoccus sp.]|nr:RNA-binding protein [Phycicoccus sp.]
MGLIHPVDLSEWHRWQEAQRPFAARLKGRLAALRGTRTKGVLTKGGAAPRILIALEAVKATTVAAQLAPLHHLPLDDVAILAPTSIVDLLPSHAWVESHGELAALAHEVVHDSSVVLSTGDYLGVGAATRTALADRTRFVTVQHGLLTPHAPPLAEWTTVLAWTEDDGHFWRSGRPNIGVRTVGAQLLWEAAHPVTGPPEPLSDAERAAPPIYLGQLHGAELPRDALAASARDFCLSTGATYRPHPSETDKASVASHAAWAADGIRIDRSRLPLTHLRRPVVSVYSTGVLEAAAAGLGAWVHFEDPPAWLADFWDRQGMSRWGKQPTRPSALPSVEPAASIASVLQEMLSS